MNADAVVEMSDAEAVIADAPVLEGAVNAAVAATDPSATLDSVREQAEAARGMKKLWGRKGYPSRTSRTSARVVAGERLVGGGGARARPSRPLGLAVSPPALSPRSY